MTTKDNNQPTTTIPNNKGTTMTTFDLLGTKKAIDNSRKQKETTEKKQELQVTGFLNIQQTATILNLSVYRIRQIYWEGIFKTAKMVGKRIYIEEKEVRELKTARDSTTRQSSTLNELRYGKRVRISTSTIMAIVNNDGQLSSLEKTTVLQVLMKYDKEAQRLIEKLQPDTNSK